MHTQSPLHEALTDRETDVLSCLVDGLSNSEIAERLYLSTNTVKWYVRQINRKLNTSNRDEIVEAAWKSGLLNDGGASETFAVSQNLPRQTTPFVGRDAELDELAALLAQVDVRLLTILAPGGMGKTRLALEVAEQQLYNFKHGVYFVPLQPLAEATHIVPQIATSTGYQFSDDQRTPKQQILDYLSNKQMLLVLDNFEHLLEGAILITEILRAAPQVKVLATSREKLNLSGETVYSLRGMQFPTWETPADALQYDAVQLLVQAAKRVNPDWDVSADNLDYVARVCRLTAGMPLGILLAASWLDVFSLERICEEIQNNVDILETEMRDVPGRQRSIRAVFEYSWQRLQPLEQQVFMTMSVFRGGCTPRAAEQVTGASPRTLQALVNKALLLKSAAGRYDIHELLRQYAEMQLEHSGEAEKARNAHKSYYIDAIHQREDDVRGHRQIEAFKEIEADFENVRAAWQWAVRQRDYASLCRMGAIVNYASNRSRQQDSLELLAAALEQIAVETRAADVAARAWLQIRYATFVDNHEEAETLLRDSLAIVRKLDDRREMTLCLRFLSGAIAAQGRLAEALPLAEESLALATEVGDQWLMATVHHFVGYLTTGLGQLERGNEHTLQAYQLRSEIGDRVGMAHALNNLGAFVSSTGDWQASERHHQQALALRRETGHHAGIAQSLTALGYIAFVKGHFEEAEQLAGESLLIASDINQPYTIASSLLAMSVIAELKGNYAEAHRMAQESLILAQVDGNWDTISRAKHRLGQTLCCLEAYDDAIPYLSIDLNRRLEIGDVPNVLGGVAAFAQIVAHRGQHERAVELLGLVFEHPIQMQYLVQHPRLVELRHQLQSELGEDVYKTAWERGKSLDLETVAQELLAEFGTETTE